MSTSSSNNSSAPDPDDRESFFFMLRVKVRCALNSLPEPERQLMWSIFVDGLSLRDAAEQLGVAYSTAWDRVERAQERLRAELKDDWFIKSYRELYDLDD